MELPQRGETKWEMMMNDQCYVRRMADGIIYGRFDTRQQAHDWAKELGDYELMRKVPAEYMVEWLVYSPDYVRD